MFLIVLLILAGALAFLQWHLVHSSPRVLSRILPKRLAYGVGMGFFIIAIFCSFYATQAMRDPESMLQSFVQAFLGMWFMLATTAEARGSDGDEQMLRRVFAMMGLLMVVIIGSLYLTDPRAMATLNMLLVAGGLWVTTNYFQFLDRGR